MPRRKNRKVDENQEVWKKNQTAGRSGVEEDHITKGIFYLLSRQGQKRDKKLKFNSF